MWYWGRRRVVRWIMERGEEEEGRGRYRKWGEVQGRGEVQDVEWMEEEEVERKGRGKRRVI